MIMKAVFPRQVSYLSGTGGTVIMKEVFSKKGPPLLSSYSGSNMIVTSAKFLTQNFQLHHSDNNLVNGQV